MSRWMIRVVCCLWMLGAGGCATKAQLVLQQPVVKAEAKLPDGQGWWYARFRIHWPEDAQPTWSMDALLAREVVAPVLEQYRQDIHLWRFHRRAVRKGGHLFSFIFYSSPQLAEQIYSAINSDPLLSQLKQEKRIDSVIFDDLKTITRPNIADTSDKSWFGPVQRAWPHFIMGASQMWLSLVDELAQARDRGQEKTVLYREVQDQVTGIWTQQGQHAWLHHLSALYAYQPLMIRY